ncbi:hypothetical protein GCM10010096_21820 [Alcaligenes pakistanensis]|uniref:DUF4390 domain-containing protein n=1 Tax=Alcaligenes pakistanensis TaxID=1482717 RepID=A0A8H9IIJ1_9BURK|nr:DUF4390 domain-containing protein [Alcaligenes pakistanensis]GHC49663.1 hypothetical protein GCM10010096_21820 [Alcaligenes pakistanensis]HCA17765.1 DUF4390 domain-containing protein [Alcaligenes faecalis]
MWRVFLSFLLIFNCALSSATTIVPVASSGERVVKVEPRIRDDKLYIDADVEFELSPELRTAAEKGVPLYFTVEVELAQPRWYWFDKNVVKEQQTWRVVYNALTRQWRVGTGDLSLPESSMNDALGMLRHIRGWAVAYVADLDHDQEYQGRLRLRLDTSLLARPFQVDAINSSAWTLATPWKTFSFSVSVAEPQP